MGDFKVVQISKLGEIVIDLGGKVHIIIHLGDLQHSVELGDKLSLYTEIPCLNSVTISPTNSPNVSS
jgi:hypothetical protein